MILSDPEIIYIFLVYFYIGMVGLCMGSFSSAIAHRTISGESWILSSGVHRTAARSQCPNCDHRLSWFDLIPVLSWIFCLGKCRYCRHPVSVKYPLIELCGGLLMGVVFYAGARGWMLIAVVVGLPFLLAAGLILQKKKTPPLYMLSIAFSEVILSGYILL